MSRKVVVFCCFWFVVGVNVYIGSLKYFHGIFVSLAERLIKEAVNNLREALELYLEEFLCEEVGEGIILKEDKNNRVIGIEVLHFSHSRCFNQY